MLDKYFILFMALELFEDILNWCQKGIINYRNGIDYLMSFKLCNTMTAAMQIFFTFFLSLNFLFFKYSANKQGFYFWIIWSMTYFDMFLIIQRSDTFDWKTIVFIIHYLIQLIWCQYNGSFLLKVICCENNII
jgi:hypothetical protein